MINDFVIELPSLKWDKDFLINDLTTNWERKSHSQNSGQYMSITPKLNSTSKIKEEIIKIADQLPGLTFNTDTQYHYLYTGPNNILHPHADPDRPAALNIPLLGDIDNTPIRFHSNVSLKKESVLYEHVYNYATIVNTTVCHSVTNRSTVDRYILSISVYNTWTELVEILSNSNLTKF